MPLRADAAEKRRHIVETAYHLFKRDGFHATGTDKIIAEAEVAKTGGQSASSNSSTNSPGRQ
jgi:AcrR family transcriptional regulator